MHIESKLKTTRDRSVKEEEILTGGNKNEKKEDFKAEEIGRKTPRYFPLKYPWKP